MNLSRILSAAFAVTLCAAALVAQAPSPVAGDIVITEILANPAVVADENGEYFEICNISTHAVDLLGCSFSDLTAGGPNIFINASVIVQPGEYVTFIRGSVQATTWNIPGQVYAYVDLSSQTPSSPCSPILSCINVGQMNFGNGGNDGAEFMDPNLVVLDTALYTASAASGIALERVDLRLPWTGNNVAAPLNFDADNRGTPGQANASDVTTPFLRNTSPLAQGGVCDLQLLSPRHANAARIIVASLGNTPGFTVGLFVFNVNMDLIFDFSLVAGNGIFNDFGGNLLGGFGQSAANVTIPFVPGIAGIPLHFQYGVVDLSLNLLAVSEPLTLAIQ